MIATYNFALLLWGALNRYQDTFFFPEKPGVAAWLNLVQFTVAWLGQLFLFYHVVTLLPSRPAKTRSAIIAYLIFLVISLVPTIAEPFIMLDPDARRDRDWFDALYIVGPMLYLIGPMVQILGFAALWAQASEIKRSRSSDGNAADDALSVRGLVVQAVVFLLVGLSFVWRMKIPGKHWTGYWTWDLRDWYWSAGFATVNNLIFAVVQGVLALIAWRQKGDGGEIGERTALLA
ncbi:hypothetical protein Q7P37_009005 [Cladosporium fusiforme]